MTLGDSVPARDAAVGAILSALDDWRRRNSSIADPPTIFTVLEETIGIRIRVGERRHEAVCVVAYDCSVTLSLGPIISEDFPPLEDVSSFVGQTVIPAIEALAFEEIHQNVHHDKRRWVGVAVFSGTVPKGMLKTYRRRAWPTFRHPV